MFQTNAVYDLDLYVWSMPVRIQSVSARAPVFNGHRSSAFNGIDLRPDSAAGVDPESHRARV